MSSKSCSHFRNILSDGLKTKNGDFIKIGIFILILSKNVGAERRKECLISCKTIQIASFCPRTKHEWDLAAEKMGCAHIQQDCTKKDNFLYHCFLHGVVFIEVCAPKTKIIGGYCPKFDPVGKMVVEDFKADCKIHPISCPNVFESSEAYIHQECFKMMEKVQDTTESENNCSRILDPRSTISDEKHFIDNSFLRNLEKSAPSVLGILFPWTTIWLIILWYKRKERIRHRRLLFKNNNKRCEHKVPEEENDPFIVETKSKEKVQTENVSFSCS